MCTVCKKYVHNACDKEIDKAGVFCGTQCYEHGNYPNDIVSSVTSLPSSFTYTVCLCCFWQM